jgi:putative chitinase
MTDLLSLPVMQKLWPNGDQHVPGLLEGIVAAASVVLPKYGLVTPLSVALFMAQCSEECGAGLEMIENDNFTAEQLLRLFPTHFTGTMAARYAHNQQMICDVAYGGRMGNAPPPSDDGYNYRGRGMTNCTGKDGYAAVAKKTSIDVIGHPEFFSDPRYALELGVADFELCGCLPYALKGDVVSTSAMLNDGHIVPPSAINGLASREQWTAKWKSALIP